MFPIDPVRLMSRAFQVSRTEKVEKLRSERRQEERRAPPNPAPKDSQHASDEDDSDAGQGPRIDVLG